MGSSSEVLLSATSEPTSADAADQGLCLRVSIGVLRLALNMTCVQDLGVQDLRVSGSGYQGLSGLRSPAATDLQRQDLRP